MGEALEKIDFNRLLSGTVAEAWSRCLPVWRARGRIEDLPRNLHLGRYRVSPEKWLGRAFAEAFAADWSFIAQKLSSPDLIEAACAHDTLRYMAEGGEPVVCEGVWSVTAPIPAWIWAELSDCPHRYEAFRGSTLGELFRFESEQGL